MNGQMYHKKVNDTNNLNMDPSVFRDFLNCFFLGFIQIQI
jgi:hypothetical protein